MAFEVSDRDQRLARRQRQPLPNKQSDHDPADQAWPGGRRDGIDLANRDVCFMQHLPNQAGQNLDMGAGGNFRNDPAERAVGVILANHGLGEDLPVAADQCSGAVIA